MGDILTELTGKDLLSFSQNFNIRRNYDGDTEFPDRKTRFLEAEWLRLSAGQRLPTAAFVHAFDAEAQIGKRPSFEKVKVEKLFIKEKINETEQIQLLKTRGVAGTDALYNYVFNDAGRLAENVKTRTEVIKQELLSTGKVTVHENNLDYVIDYGVPADNFFTLDWDDPEHDILGDIRGMVNYLNSIGETPNRAKTSPDILLKMEKNSGIQIAIGGIYEKGILPGIEQLNNLMMSYFGFTIKTNNQYYSYTQPDGQTPKKRYWDRNTFVLYTESSNGSVGIGLWGPTPEEEKLGPWDSKSAQQFITITQWSTPDPVATWTKASGLFVPVLPDPAALLIAKVSSEVLETLTVTSEAGTGAGKTAITVSPTLGSGNSYKYKLAANPTMPVYDQLISGGYANWNGTDEITATNGQKIVIVEINANGHARKAGMATVTANS
jgi:hypothetical protein